MLMLVVPAYKLELISFRCSISRTRNGVRKVSKPCQPTGWYNGSVSRLADGSCNFSGNYIIRRRFSERPR